MEETRLEAYLAALPFDLVCPAVGSRHSSLLRVAGLLANKDFDCCLVRIHLRKLALACELSESDILDIEKGYNKFKARGGGYYE